MQRECWKRVSAAALLLMGIVAISGCCASGGGSSHKYFMETESDANVYVAKYEADIDKIAILPFKAPTELIGMSVSDLFVTEMLRAGRYELVERSQIAKVLGESELALAGLSNADAIEAGAMAGAQGVIVGTVSEYSKMARRGHAYPVVGISARLIDTTTGKIVWSVDLSKRAESKSDTLSTHARDVVHEMCASLYQQWRHQKKKIGTRRSSSKSSKEDEDYNAPVGYSSAEAESSAPPETPGGFAVSDLGLREVEIKWKSPVDNPAKYQIERSTSRQGPFETLGRVSPSKRRYLDEGSRDEPLEDSTTYYYRLVAIGTTGLKSKPTEVLESLTAPPPDAPPDLSAETTGSREITLSWFKPQSEDVVEYRVERAIASEPELFTEIGVVRSPSYTDGGTSTTDLKDSTKYLYRVSSVNRVGAQGAFSSPVSATTPPPPAKVSGIEAASAEVRCLPLSWEPNAEEDVSTYIIYRSSGKDGEYAEVGRVAGRTSTEFLDGGRDPGSLEDETEYFYILVAVNAVGAVSEDSDPVSGVTRAPPPAVTGVRAESGMAREVKVTWEQSSDEKVVGYRIWRRKAGDGDFDAVGTVDNLETTEFLDRGPVKASLFGGKPEMSALDDAGLYEYKVIAFNTARAESRDAEVVEARTKDRPAAPGRVLVSEKIPQAIEVAWTRNPEDDIDHYLVEAGSSSNGRYKQLASVDADADSLSCKDRSLKHGETKYYRVKVIDKDGLESDWSEPKEGMAKPLPDAPTELSAEYGDDSVKVTWSGPEQDDVVKYQVWNKSFMSWNLIDSVDQPAYTFSGGGKATLIISVSAVDEDGLESEKSETLEVKDIALD
ncbi:MAG: fibronectin type III domain-containing protein [Verrucomicrobia bacterium]|nr:fibronectin type III domain-containing protein [Verrucomicrobiota bacterium]